MRPVVRGIRRRYNPASVYQAAESTAVRQSLFLSCELEEEKWRFV